MKQLRDFIRFLCACGVMLVICIPVLLIGLVWYVALWMLGEETENQPKTKSDL